MQQQQKGAEKKQEVTCRRTIIKVPILNKKLNGLDSRIWGISELVQSTTLHLLHCHSKIIQPWMA